jgi:hypothetical protein
VTLKKLSPWPLYYVAGSRVFEGVWRVKGCAVIAPRRRNIRYYRRPGPTSATHLLNDILMLPLGAASRPVRPILFV